MPVRVVGREEAGRPVVVAGQVAALVAQHRRRVGQQVGDHAVALTAVHRRDQAGGERQRVVLVRQAERLRLSQRERTGEVVAAVQRPRVLDQPPVRRCGDRARRVDILVRQIVGTVTGGVAQGAQLVDAQQGRRGGRRR